MTWARFVLLVLGLVPVGKSRSATFKRKNAMTPGQIRLMQQRLKDKFDATIVVDGFWGPVCQRACRAYLKSLMPKDNRWPKADQRSLMEFYGDPGDEDNLVVLEFPYPMFYGDKRVEKTRVHKKCKASLERVLNKIRLLVEHHPEIMDEAEDYGGVYNYRLKRGGSSYSLHAWGAAIDLDADDNSFRASWPMQADMPLEIMEAFASEGWVSGGAFWGYDAMHFQATQI